MDNAGQASTDRRSVNPLGCDKEPIMKKLNLLAYPLVAALSLVAAGAAFADDITPDNTATVPMIDAKSRDQVQSELFQARKNGSIKVWSTTYNHMTAAKSVKTRDEVRSEVLADRGHGYNAYYGEDSGSFALNRQAPAREAAPLYARNAQ
jgi:hypothetical protein